MQKAKNQQRLTISYLDDCLPNIGEIPKLPRHCSVQVYQRASQPAQKRDASEN